MENSGVRPCNPLRYNKKSTEGRLAQLGERGVRNAEAEGSNPLPSTSIRHS